MDNPDRSKNDDDTAERPQIIPVSALFPRSRIEEAVNGLGADDWASAERVFDRCIEEIDRGEPLILIPSHIAMLPTEDSDTTTIADVLLRRGAGRYTARCPDHGMYVWLLRV